jgi:hypothetical protein
VVVHGHCQLFFDRLLPNHVLIQKFLYFQRFGDLVGGAGGSLDLVVFENGIADGDALVANVGSRILAWAGDQLAHNVLGLMTKAAAECFVAGRSFHLSAPCGRGGGGQNP